MSSYEKAMNALREVDAAGDVAQAYAGENKSATVRVRAAFQTAKDALHEAKKEVQAIKKGEDSPQDVAKYFTQE